MQTAPRFRGRDRRAVILDAAAGAKCSGNVKTPLEGSLESLSHARHYSTLPRAAPVEPGFLRGTSTSRLNSATSTPSWLKTRVCTLTVPRSSLDCDSFFSSTSDSTNSVSPWNTGAGCLSSSVARFAIALPLTSETDMPSASEYTSGPTTTLRPCWDLAAYTSVSDVSGKAIAN